MPASRVALIAAAAAVLAPAVSLAQYANEPFFDGTVAQSQAFGLEMIALRLRVADTFPPPVDEELEEQLEAMVGADLERFHGTLAERDPALASDLRAALEEVVEAVEDGEDAGAQTEGARALLSRSYDVMFDAGTRQASAFRGALLSSLLLAEGGVAEAYEEGTEELWGFPIGWAALQRVEALWAEVAPLASDSRRVETEELIAGLHELYHSPHPDAFEPEKAEDAEALAHAMVGIIEEVVDASLYTGRDTPRLAEHLADVVGASCEAIAAGEPEIGKEGIYAALDHYLVNIAGALELIAPDVAEQGERLFPRFVLLEDDDDDGGDGDDEEAEEEAEEGAISDEQACLKLRETFLQARRALGG